MLDKNDKLLIAAGSVFAVTSVLTHAVKTHRTEAKKRAAIQKESELRIAAYGAASDVMKKRIREGRYDKDWTNLFADYNAEIAFQLIVAQLEDES